MDDLHDKISVEKYILYKQNYKLKLMEDLIIINRTKRQKNRPQAELQKNTKIRKKKKLLLNIID